MRVTSTKKGQGMPSLGQGRLDFDADLLDELGGPVATNFTEDSAKASVDALLASASRYASPAEYRALVSFIGRLPRYSPFNRMLVHIQDPGAQRRFQQHLEGVLQVQEDVSRPAGVHGGVERGHRRNQGRHRLVVEHPRFLLELHRPSGRRSVDAVAKSCTGWRPTPSRFETTLRSGVRSCGRIGGRVT